MHMTMMSISTMTVEFLIADKWFTCQTQTMVAARASLEKSKIQGQLQVIKPVSATIQSGLTKVWADTIWVLELLQPQHNSITISSKSALFQETWVLLETINL